MQNNVGAVITNMEYGSPTSNAETYGERDEAFLKSLEDYGKAQGITLTEEGEALEGKNRFAAEGFLSEKECQSLIDLTAVNTFTSPFTISGQVQL